MSSAVITPTQDVDSRLLNRELSWLDFNERVLALAERRSLPLLERTKFLAICSSNLDEFFQVRVGGLKMQLTQWPDLGSTTRGRLAPDGTLQPAFEHVMANEGRY